MRVGGVIGVSYDAFIDDIQVIYVTYVHVIVVVVVLVFTHFPQRLLRKLSFQP